MHPDLMHEVRYYRPEGLVALSAGFATLGLITVYRAVKAIWEAR